MHHAFSSSSPGEHRLCRQQGQTPRELSQDPDVPRESAEQLRTGALSMIRNFAAGHDEYFRVYVDGFNAHREDPDHRPIQLATRELSLAGVRRTMLGVTMARLRAWVQAAPAGEAREERAKVLREIHEQGTKELQAHGMRWHFANQLPSVTYTTHIEHDIRQLETRQEEIINPPEGTQAPRRMYRLQEAAQLNTGIQRLTYARDFTSLSPWAYAETCTAYLRWHLRPNDAESRQRISQLPAYYRDITNVRKELCWALAANRAHAASISDPATRFEEFQEVERSRDNLQLELLELGVDTQFGFVTDVREAPIGERRVDSEGHIWEKQAPNRWTSARNPGLTWSDELMARQTRDILNPRIDMAQQPIDITDSRNGYEELLRESQGRLFEVEREMIDRPRDSDLIIRRIDLQRRIARLERIIEARERGLTPEQRYRHRFEELAQRLERYEFGEPAVDACLLRLSRAFSALSSTQQTVLAGYRADMAERLSKQGFRLAVLERSGERSEARLLLQAISPRSGAASTVPRALAVLERDPSGTIAEVSHRAVTETRGETEVVTYTATFTAYNRPEEVERRLRPIITALGTASTERNVETGALTLRSMTEEQFRRALHAMSRDHDGSDRTRIARRQADQRSMDTFLTRLRALDALETESGRETAAKEVAVAAEAVHARYVTLVERDILEGIYFTRHLDRLLATTSRRVKTLTAETFEYETAFMPQY